MSSTFANSKFNNDISKWDVSDVTDIRYMFTNSVFNKDLSEWSTGNAIGVDSMFVGTSMFESESSN